MSVEPGDDDSDAIYSVSEGFDDTEHIGGGLMESIYMLREADQQYWIGKEGGYRAQVKVTPEIYHCQHEWDQQNPLPEDRRPECTTCKRDLSSYSKVFTPDGTDNLSVEEDKPIPGASVDSEALRAAK